MTIHAIAQKGQPGAPEAIERINEGMARIRESGEWLAIVKRSLAPGAVKAE